MSQQPQKTGVSQAAKNFFAKHASAVEEARNAENIMQSTTLPVGFKGQAIVVNAFSDELKPKKDDKGNVNEEPGILVVIELSVINDETNQGVKAKKAYYIQTQGKATWQNKLEWMLNEFENQFGITRDERKLELEQIFEILKDDKVFHIEIKSGYQGRKDVIVSTAETVDATGSANTTVGTESFQKGDKVIFMDTPSEVLEVDGDNVKIKTQNGNTRTVMASQVTKP